MSMRIGSRICLWSWVTLILAMPIDALAKANKFGPHVEYVAAVITSIEVSDSPEDADFNILLRPVSVADSANFWSLFWRPYTCSISNNWVDDTVVPRVNTVIQKHKNDFSNECKQCAEVGTNSGKDGLACEIKGGESVNPCPVLFGCVACVYDLARLIDTSLGDLDGREYEEPLARVVHPQKDLPLTGKNWDAVQSMNNNLHYTLEDIGVKAEVFLGPSDHPGYVGYSDLNKNLTAATHAMGLGRAKEYEGSICNELSWDGAKWLPNSASEFFPVMWDDHSHYCGQHVWVSGRVAWDNSHDCRPEIHPLSSMIAQQEVMGLNSYEYLAGMFIDGSRCAEGPDNENAAGWTECQGVHWAYNYRCMALSADKKSPWFDYRVVKEDSNNYDYKLDPQSWWHRPYQDAVSAPPSKFLFNPYWLVPPSALPVPGCLQEKKGGTCNVAEPYCSIESVLDPALNVTFIKQYPPAENANKSLPSGVCPSLQVEMDLKKPEGGAWVGRIKAGWKYPSADLTLTSSLASPKGGVLSVDPPKSISPENNSTACVVPKGTKKDPKLRRWFTWQTSTTRTNDVDAAGKLSWTWEKPDGAAWLNAIPDANKFSTLINGLSVPYPRPNAGSAKVSLFINNQMAAWRKANLDGAIRPTVQIKVEPKSLVFNQETKRKDFVANVSAQTSNFCGDNGEATTFTWMQGDELKTFAYGAKAYAKPNAPITVAANSKALPIQVLATDEWDVEYAAATHVLLPSRLIVDSTVSCADGDAVISANYNAPAGFANASDVPPTLKVGLCKTTKASVVAEVDPGDFAKFYSNLKKPNISVLWTDLEVATESTQWEFKPALQLSSVVKFAFPSATTSEGQLTAVSTSGTPFHFRAKALVKDLVTLVETTEVVNGSNDFTTPAQMASNLVKLWPLWRQGSPVPDPHPCGGECDPKKRKPNADRFAENFSRLRFQLEMTKGKHNVSDLRQALERFVDRAFRHAATKRGIPYASRATMRPKRRDDERNRGVFATRARAALMRKLVADGRSGRF